MSDQAVLEAASHWQQQLPSYSAQFEQQRRLSPEIAQEFAAAGFFNMLVPKCYGGLEVHPKTFVEVLTRLAVGDASAAWNAMIGSTTGVLSASLPEQGAIDIYQSQTNPMTVGVTAPMGKAKKVDGGYEITGRWPFGSGSQNAHWIGGGCFVFENDEQRMTPFGPEIRIMMFNADQVNIEDTWHVSGLRGTGSHHFNVSNQFVKEEHSIVMGAKAVVQTPLYQFPLLGLLAMGVSAVAVGIGYRAIEEIKTLAGVKSPTGSNRKLVDRPMVQSEMAKAVADVESAEAYMHKVIDTAFAKASKGEKLGMEEKAKLRLAAANATHKSVAAVDRLYQLGGGTSIYEESFLQQCLRDVHVITQHMMVAAPIFEVTGKVELGVDPKQLL